MRLTLPFALAFGAVLSAVAGYALQRPSSGAPAAAPSGSGAAAAAPPVPVNVVSVQPEAFAVSVQATAGEPVLTLHPLDG